MKVEIICVDSYCNRCGGVTSSFNQLAYCPACGEDCCENCAIDFDYCPVCWEEEDNEDEEEGEI